MRRLWWIAGGVGAAALAVLAVAPWRAEAETVRLAPDDPATVALGAQVYAAECAACHGAELKGQPDWRTRDAAGLLPAPPHDATGHTWHHDGDALFRIVKLGLPEMIGDPGYATAMPVYGGVLSDAEIVAVLSYIVSTWPAEIRAAHDARAASR